MDILASAKRVFDTEIEALVRVRDALDGRFRELVDAVTGCEGKVVVTGMGKSGHVGSKIAATLASLGTPAFFLHPAEALHGDLGMVQQKDAVIAVSHSGESEELTKLIPGIKVIGARLIAVSGNPDSTLVRYSDLSFVFPEMREACPLNLAPTCSTTAAMVFGDALAVCAAQVYGFGERNFALLHPAGALGKKLLLRVSDLMNAGDKNAAVAAGTPLKDAIVVMSQKALGIVCAVRDGKLAGVFTDGDLRRALARGVDVYRVAIDEVMSKTPLTVAPDILAVEALNLMNSRKISALPVVDGERLLGTIRINDITGAGIVL